MQEDSHFVILESSLQQKWYRLVKKAQRHATEDVYWDAKEANIFIQPHFDEADKQEQLRAESELEDIGEIKQR